MIGINELVDLWRLAGGKFHGPNVETGTMPEAQLMLFLRALVGNQPSGEVWVRVQAAVDAVNSSVTKL